MRRLKKSRKRRTSINVGVQTIRDAISQSKVQVQLEVDTGLVEVQASHFDLDDIEISSRSVNCLPEFISIKGVVIYPAQYCVSKGRVRYCQLLPPLNE